MSSEVRTNCDNTSAISYVNRYGGCHCSVMNDISKTIWEWCIQQHIDIKAVHIAGVDNTMADTLSRDYNRNVEWSLDPDVFVSLCYVFGHPDIDLFASRLNNKLPLYYSWKPDPGASGSMLCPSHGKMSLAMPSHP